MIQKLTKFFNLIKENKQTRILSIMTIAMLFIFTIGYSLSMFTGGSNKKVANIKVNDLSFNMTTNSGESDDRILHLQAGKLEQFDIILTNLNKVNVKYEIIYELCNNQDCTSASKDIPKDLLVYKEKEDTNISGSLDISKSNSIRILTQNKSNNDYYIKLSLNAGYSWNDLDLIGQIKDVISINQDIDIIAYVDGKEVSELPTTCFYTSISSAYKGNTKLDDVTVTFNCNYVSNSWSYVVDNIKNLPDKIIVNFEHTGINAVEYLTILQQKDTNNINGLFIDDTSDKNLRYAGATPNNYISFNNELWRIIGIFNVYNNDTERYEKLVKIIRNESLGEYSWDSSASSINSGYGINEWSQADLMTELNTDYLDTNKTSGTTYWYNGRSNEKSGSYDYSKNIKSGYIDKIASVRWNLGGYSDYQSSVTKYYVAERGTTHITNPNDGIARTNVWNGKIALMYPSDYGYASTDNICRNSLDSSKLNLNYAACEKNNYLFSNGKKNQYLLSSDSSGSTFVFLVYNGNVGVASAGVIYPIYPSLYLKLDIQITEGSGTNTAPYVIDNNF